MPVPRGSLLPPPQPSGGGTATQGHGTALDQSGIGIGNGVKGRTGRGEGSKALYPIASCQTKFNLEGKKLLFCEGAPLGLVTDVPALHCHLVICREVSHCQSAPEGGGDTSEN